MRSVPGMGFGLAAVLLLALTCAGAQSARAYFAGGGKDAAKGNDCLIGYNGVDESDVTTEGKKQVVSCTDCDPACDHDGDPTANGSCTFQVGVCLDQPGVPNCTPAAGLDTAKASAKVKGQKGKIDVQLPQLLEGSVCGALLDLDVPVKVTKKGAKDGSGTVKLSAQVKKNKDEGIDKTRKDKDKLTYVCVPRAEGDACPVTTTTVTTSSTSTTLEVTTTSIAPSTTSTTTVPTTTSTIVTTTSTTTVSTTTSTIVTTTSTTTIPTTTSTIVTTTSTLVSSTSTTTESTSTSTTLPGSTTTTSTEPSTTLTTTSTTIEPTTTSTSVPTVLSFTTGAPTGSCGAVKQGSTGTVRKVLGCGGLNVGGGNSTVAEGPTPAGAETQLNITGGPTIFTASGRTSGQTGSSFNCSDTGCQFGPWLPIINAGTSTCVQNTFGSPASGTLDAGAGTFTGAFPLSSQVYLTGNDVTPCPQCIAGVCDPTWVSSTADPGQDSGDPCTAVNANGDNYECRPSAASILGSPFPVPLNPITTATASFSNASGLFCSPQATAGAFGCKATTSLLCPGTGLPTYVEEVGTPGGAITGSPTAVTLASVFCIPSVGGIVDIAANLPGPGATSLPGTMKLLP